MQRTILIVIFILIAAGTPSLPAAFNYSSSGSVYFQDFDSLAASDTDHPWSNDSTIPGWHLFRVTAKDDATPLPVALYDASDGSAENGRFYSLGTSADRALGGVGGGNFGYPSDLATAVPINEPVGWLAASFTNGTGLPLILFTVAFDGEQWRDAGDNEPPYPQTMEFQYGFGTDFSTVSSWTSPGGNFDFTSPVFTTAAGPIDGNSIGRVADLGGTISDLSWQAGETLWLRWATKNDLGLDHAMAIDNYSFSAGAADVSAVPEAGAATVWGVICCLSGMTYGVRVLIRFYSTVRQK